MTTQPPKLPSCEEERDELRRQVQTAARLAHMTRSPGWSEVLRPLLQQRQANTIRELCLEQDINELRCLQMRVQEIDYLLDFVENTIAMAEQAQHVLNEEDRLTSA